MEYLGRIEPLVARLVEILHVAGAPAVEPRAQLRQFRMTQGQRDATQIETELGGSGLHRVRRGRGHD